MSRFERWSVWVTSVLTTVTGLLYLWMKYAMEPTEPWAVVNHPLQPWILKAHIVVAPLLVFALGLVTLRHVWRHFQNGVLRGRRSGIAAALVAAPMIFTGYLLQTATHAGWLRILIWAHVITGSVYAAGLVAHQLAVKQPTPKQGGGSTEQGPRRTNAPPLVTSNRWNDNS